MHIHMDTQNPINNLWIYKFLTQKIIKKVQHVDNH
jgi:hypothetical protein